MINKKLFFKTKEFVLGAALLTTLTGCVGYVEGPRAGVYVAPPVVEVGFAVQDDYIYYPNYEIYYSSSRHQYACLNGGEWILRPAPIGVSVDVLFASPSVRMNFHDSPANHHAEIVRQHPRNSSSHGQKENRNDDQREGRGNGNGNGHGR